MECQAPHSGGKENMRSGHACGNSLLNLDSWLWQSTVLLFFNFGNPRSKHCGLPQYVAYIWKRSLASEIQLPQFYI
jgi:hypothetical protein